MKVSATFVFEYGLSPEEYRVGRNSLDVNEDMTIREVIDLCRQSQPDHDAKLFHTDVIEIRKVVEKMPTNF